MVLTYLFLFLYLYLSSGPEATLIVRGWDTALDFSNLLTYTDTALLIQHQKVSPIIGWEAAVNM